MTDSINMHQPTPRAREAAPTATAARAPSLRGVLARGGQLALIGAVALADRFVPAQAAGRGALPQPTVAAGLALPQPHARQLKDITNNNFNGGGGGFTNNNDNCGGGSITNNNFGGGNNNNNNNCGGGGTITNNNNNGRRLRAEQAVAEASATQPHLRTWIRANQGR